jgi:chlorobactene glucosyltransferase
MYFDAYTIISIALAAVSCGLLGIGLLNLARFPRLPKVGTPQPESARCSVLVPARNEERCIEACVRSLCLQDDLNTEVIVLDDGSTDATPQILARLQQEFPALRVITGKPLPQGWIGKSWACDQLSKAATGDLLLFTDADTEHAPTTVRRTREYMRTHDVALLTMVPFEELGSFGEHVVIPMVHTLYFAYLPNDLILHHRSVSFSAANGQFMCFTRSAYQTVRGHECVKNSLVEDVFLAKAVKRAGLRISLVDGSDAVSCRMYTNAREVTEGFSKNFFPATSYSIPLTLLFLGHLFTTYVAPVGVFVAGIAASREDLVLLAGIQLVALALIRGMIAYRFSMPWWHMFLAPITGVWSMFIGINSIRWAYSRRGATWKGRAYSQQGTHHA